MFKNILLLKQGAFLCSACITPLCPCMYVALHEWTTEMLQMGVRPYMDEPFFGFLGLKRGM